MNSLNFVREKLFSIIKGKLRKDTNTLNKRNLSGTSEKIPLTPFIKGEMYSFSSPLTGERTKEGGFKKKFHSIPSPLGRGLGGGFTLVELIVVVTILAILGTIAFISLQGYTQEARDSKRISDVRSLITKITIENAKGTSYSEIMDEGGTGTSLKINGTTQTGTQNKDEPINWEVLKENAENFRDPLTKKPYPFAYAVGNAGNVGYDFMQLAYVSEKTGLTKLMGNYYEMLPLDSPSLFIGCIADEDEEIEENGCPIYDLGIPYTPPVYANCEPQQVTITNGNIYNITESRNHKGKITLTITGASEIQNGYTEYTQTFKCKNGAFGAIGEETSRLKCNTNFEVLGEECVSYVNNKYWSKISLAKTWGLNSISVCGNTDCSFNSSTSTTSPNYGREFDITNYPAFMACADLGKGWKLPTKQDLKDLQMEGGRGILDLEYNYYWSSTEGSESIARVVLMSNGSQLYNYGKANRSWYVVCMHD